MKVMRKGQGEPYEAPHHFKYWAMNKIKMDVTQRLQLGVSHFLPGGGSDMTSSPLERIYYVISGSVLVKGKAGEYILNPDDLIYIAPDEERSFENNGTTPATILVIMAKVD